MHRRREQRRSGGAVVASALAAVLGFAVLIFVLTKAAVPMITVLSVASFNSPKVYAGLLAVLVGLPGLLFTLPRAVRGPEPYIPPSLHRRERSHQQSFLATDVAGLAAILISQVPIPAPWAAEGKAATVANITMSAEIVELSWAFAWPSLILLGIGILTAFLARVYQHAAGVRVLTIIVVVGAPVAVWFYLTHSVLA